MKTRDRGKQKEVNRQTFVEGMDRFVVKYISMREKKTKDKVKTGRRICRKEMIVFIILTVMVQVTGCGSQKAIPEGGDDVTTFSSGNLNGDIVGGSELTCLADSREEAEEIAKSYGIELVHFSSGVASFHTDGDPADVIKRGKEQGLKELSINRYNKAF